MTLKRDGDVLNAQENLQEDIKKVCEILNIKNCNVDSLPNYKSGLRTDRDYRKFYNNTTRKIVENLFEKQLKPPSSLKVYSKFLQYPIRAS